MEDAAVAAGAVAASMIAGSTITHVVEGLKQAFLPSHWAKVAAWIVGGALGAAGQIMLVMAAGLDPRMIAIGTGAGVVAGIGESVSYAMTKTRTLDKVRTAYAAEGLPVPDEKGKPQPLPEDPPAPRSRAAKK